MATVITFPGGRHTRATEGVEPKLAATMAERRVLMQSLATNMFAQYQTQRLDPAATPIWRPERPFNQDVRDRLHQEWYTGLRHAHFAKELVGIAGMLAEIEGEANGVHWTRRPQSEFQALAEAVCRQEVWRQFNLAPRGKDGLAWKKKHVPLLKDQAAGERIIGADEAWLERINGPMGCRQRSDPRRAS